MRCLPIEGLYAIHFCVSFHCWFSVPTLIFSPLSLEEAHVAPPSKGFPILATDEYTNHPSSSLSSGFHQAVLLERKPPCFWNSRNTTANTWVSDLIVIEYCYYANLLLLPSSFHLSSTKTSNPKQLDIPPAVFRSPTAAGVKQATRKLLLWI